MEASVDGTGAYTYNSDIPSWKISPFWGGIVLGALDELDNYRQTETSLLNEYSHHETFDIDYRVEVETTVMPNGELNFKLNLFDIYSRIWFQSNSAFSSGGIVTIEADKFQVEGLYTLSTDNFVVTNHQFENLDANIDLGGFFNLLGDIKCFFSFLGVNCDIPNAEGSVQEKVNDTIKSKINAVNKNSPNMFIESLIKHPEANGALPLLDQAITELLQDDVSATLTLELPTCGDDARDGLINLDIITN